MSGGMGITGTRGETSWNRLAAEGQAWAKTEKTGNNSFC
jgi:hypothetical protein